MSYFTRYANDVGLADYERAPTEPPPPCPPTEPALPPDPEDEPETCDLQDCPICGGTGQRQVLAADYASPAEYVPCGCAS